MSKAVFTTGEAAKVCKVSQQTIIRCFDSGQLKGFKVPGSRFRRIPRDVLYKFMKENGIPTDALETGKHKALIMDDNPESAARMRNALETDQNFDVRVIANGFDAGMTMKEYRPDLIVLDLALPHTDGRSMCERIRKDPDFNEMKILCLRSEADDPKLEGIQSAGADEFLQKPVDIGTFLRVVRELVQVEVEVKY